MKTGRPRRNPAETMVPYSIAIEPSQRDQVRQKAKELRISSSMYICRIISKELKREQE